MLGLNSTQKESHTKFTLVYVMHYGMLIIHMPHLWKMADILQICFKNLVGILL